MTASGVLTGGITALLSLALPPPQQATAACQASQAKPDPCACLWCRSLQQLRPCTVPAELGSAEQHSRAGGMSFLARSRNSQKWGRTGSNPASASFSVRTGRRVSGETDSILLRAGAQPRKNRGSLHGWAVCSSSSRDSLGSMLANCTAPAHQAAAAGGGCTPSCDLVDGLTAACALQAPRSL